MDINELIELEPYKSCYEYGYEQGSSEQYSLAVDKARTDERAKVIDECMVAMNELAVKWFNQGCIALGDIPRLAEQLKLTK